MVFALNMALVIEEYLNYQKNSVNLNDIIAGKDFKN